jgi:hypothetical protein
MADADKLWGSRLDECELKLEASRSECRKLDIDLQTEQVRWSRNVRVPVVPGELAGRTKRHGFSARRFGEVARES